ncbi:uncharacterized protein B0H64DRAFT_364517 [Chaetomium fimeti]|uniref:FAD-binding PCMH-type domain-containing protein n=1 Tax=Chaetomium fimeti TaxID=1854472 RepID=A0AAE0HCC9_9PEZI|nr:hypothetical protein B0H64DRAFT_364517 [Chaetomium fimeti]
MPLPSSVALYGLALAFGFVTGTTLPISEVNKRQERCVASTQTQEELASLLSKKATILGPTSVDWADVTERYMAQVQPTVCLSVRPGTEDDVAEIVRFANRLDVPFYTVSRGHALTESVGRFRGIEIDLRDLRAFEVNPNNVTAFFQGGAYSHEVIDGLWDQGFVTGTGGCECVSVIGPALGGGHGLQQGRHGLTMDMLVNLNVVLANGTAVQVNETSHPDLWWAMRGAGHNFGIVTSFESKIWPEDKSKTYLVKTYQFAGRSLEAVIDRVNEFQGLGTLDPSWLASFGLYIMNTTLSKTEATINWAFVFSGSPEEGHAVLKPFDDLGPLSVDVVNVPYRVVNEYVGGGMEGRLCEGNKTHVIGTANLQTYNKTSMRAIYDLYNERIRQHPRLGDTRVLVEGYSVEGVLSHRSEDSAYALRDEHILTYFDTRFDSMDDPLIPFATEWRDHTVALWYGGQPERRPTTYVNYAAGYESLEARYGHETWRLEKLRKLKRQYDPDNKFAWYNPIFPPA